MTNRPELPVVLRLSLSPRPRGPGGGRERELQRLYPGGVDVHIRVGLRDPAAVVAAVAETGASAVLADAYPLHGLEDLRRALDPVPVLRPVFIRRSGSHAGGPEDEFSAYARLGPGGSLTTLADGEPI